MLNADLLESIVETRYLTADNYIVYRTILRTFYLEHQKMHYQMDRDTVLSLLRKQPIFSQYTPEQLTLDLQQLVKWKNLTPIQDPRKPRTILEFKNRQFQYMLSQTAIEVERMTLHWRICPPGLPDCRSARSAVSGKICTKRSGWTSCPCVRFTHGGRICRRTSSG